MSTVLIITAVMTAITAGVYYFLININNFWKKKGIVGPEPSIFYGNIKDFVLRKKGFPFNIVNFYNDYPNENYVGAFKMRTPMLVIRDLDIIKQVMIKDFDSFVQRGTELSRKGLALNLFSAPPDDWKILRHKLTPTFSSGKLKAMFHLLDASGDDFIEYMENLGQKELENDIYPRVQMYTKKAICSCAFGLELNLNDEALFSVLKKVDDSVFTVNYMHIMNLLLPGIFKNFNIDFFPSDVTNFFLKLVRDVITQRKGVPTNRQDFMDTIIAMKNNGEIHGNNKSEIDQGRILEINDQLIAANAFAFYVGGYETSASTMSYLLHELAHNQEIQDRLLTEINDVIEENGKLTYEGIQQMTYLGQLFDETLRKYPLVDPLSRVAVVDYKLPGTDIILDRGTSVAVSVRGIHYDPKYYPHPMKFDPDRFSPENVKKRHPAAYLPFGIGPRNCIGMRFGKLSSKVGIAKLLSKFRVEPSIKSSYNFKYDPNLTIPKPIDGIPLKLVPRNY